jgi:hypothetical protein
MLLLAGALLLAAEQGDHVAAHHARELADDGKAQSGSPEVLRCRGIGLGEFFEQLCLLLRGHADATICHGKLDEPRLRRWKRARTVRQRRAF